MGEYDVVVAGLGPAGTVALWHLARRGFRVIGVDMRGPGTLWGKPCGDALGAHHVREAGLPPLPSAVVKNRVEAIDVYSPGEKVRYRVRGEGYIIDREAMGKWLLEDAVNHGAEVLLSTHIVAPLIEKGRVVGVRARGGGGPVELRGRLVVEATGFTRVLRSKLPGEWPIAEDISSEDTNIAYREVIVYEDYEVEEPSVIRIYIDQELAPGGYWWFFPESPTSVNAGVGVQASLGINPRERYQRLVKTHRLFSRRFHVAKAAGAPLPTRRPSNSMVGPGIVAIGDAAYTVNPLHGGGMGYAFRAAYIAARVFEEAYEAGDISVEALWRLNVEYMRAIGARQAALDVFRIFLQRLSNSDISYGMEKRLIPEQDIYYTSSEGDISVSVIEKLNIILRGLRRPSLLARLKTVAHYMKLVKKHYNAYPDTPAGLKSWVRRLEEIYAEYRSKLG
ncbi:MAG: dehydrogenase [Hyperthermus sp.]|nr:MAG: dehydrogenase [Hyperthermus sp.]